ncbi:MAG: hypothetical protein R6V85_14695 [Polyangia bacterium]
MVSLIPRMAPAAVVLLAAACSLQFSESDPYDEAFDPGFFAGVRIAGVEGDIDLRAVESGDVLIRGTRRALGGTRRDARDNLEHAELAARDDGDVLELAFDPPLSKLGLVDLTLDRVCDLPPRMDIEICVDRGRLSTRGLRGEISLETGEGNIVVEEGGELPVSLRTDDGEVAARVRGALEVRATRRLDLEIEGTGDPPLEVESRGGAVLVALEPQNFRLTCYSGGGAITVAAELEAEIRELDDGAVMVSSGEADGARTGRIRSGGGDIDIDVLPARHSSLNEPILGSASPLQ